MRILGLSAFYHDSAAALVEDGRVVAAAQEERFTRKKFDANFPMRALEYCLAEAGCGVGDIDYVVFYDKPFVKFERLLETYLTYSPRGFTSFRMALPLWLREKLFQKSLIADELKALEPKFDWQKRLLFCEHHLSHAASAFYPVAVRTRGSAHDRRRRRMDHNRRRRSAKATISPFTRKFISRTASACSIRRSPTIPASRSIPANTS